MPDPIKKTTILVVEDDIFMVDLLSKELQNAGFNVVVAHRGGEALPKFKEIKPDLILLDIFLPDINGFDVLRQIRQDPVGYTTKVIVLSNASEEQSQKEAKRLGTVDYLVKANFSLPEIIEHIRTALAL